MFLKPSVLASLVLGSTHAQLGMTSSANKAGELNGDARRRDQSIPNLFPPDWPYKTNCLDPTGPGGFLNTTLKTCQDGQVSDFQKSDKIAIVGAGPAGVSMAYLLNKRGFNDITIFEKEDRVGGKSKRITYNGDNFDVGTVYNINKYECVELLFDEFGITEVAIDSANKPRFVSDPNVLLPNPPGISIAPLWYKEYTTAKYNIAFADMQEFLTRLRSEAQQYVGLWTQTMGSFDYYFPDESTINFDLLGISFLEWLEQRELYALISRLNVSVNAQGYGSLGEIPAFYGLMWIHPNFLIGTGTFSVIQEDWQTLWERVIDDLDIDVVQEATIKKIKRKKKKKKRKCQGDKDKGGYVKVKYRKGDNVHSKRFDHIIMAMPMPDGLAFLDATKTEIELFSRYNYKNVRIDALSVSNAGILAAVAGLAPFDVELFSWISRADQQTDYHVKSFDTKTGKTSRHQWTTDEVDGLLTFQRQALLKQRTSNTDVCMAFSIVPLGEETDDVTPQAAADLASLGIAYEHIFTNDVPDYFPWKNVTDIVDERVPWRIWDYQGDLRTWFTGSYTNFESVADVVDYNLKLVNERLCEN